MKSEFPHVETEIVKGLKYSDKVSTPLILETCSIEIEVIPTSGMYHQSTILTFKNYSNKDLSGEFVFPLPDNATVCGFAVEMDDQMIDASIVENKKAKKTFDSEVRKNHPTALLESVVGNQYKTKIYPWKSNSTKQVKIEFLSTLIHRTDGFFIDIPIEISKQEKLSNISLSILTKDEKNEPFLYTKENINFEKKNKLFLLNLGRNDLIKLENLKIQIPMEKKECVIVEENKIHNQFYFEIKQFINSKELKKINSKESNISILWDVSLSREENKKKI